MTPGYKRTELLTWLEQETSSRVRLGEVQNAWDLHFVDGLYQTVNEPVKPNGVEDWLFVH